MDIFTEKILKDVETITLAINDVLTQHTGKVNPIAQYIAVVEMETTTRKFLEMAASKLIPDISEDLLNACKRVGQDLGKESSEKTIEMFNQLQDLK